jgi:hypothetical protein
MTNSAKLEYQRRWRAKNREHYNSYMRGWNARNREHRSACNKIRYLNGGKVWRQGYEKSDAGKQVKRRYESSEKHKTAHMDRERLYRYGMPRGEFNKLAEFQGGKCAVCQELPTYMGLCVDHCHETGKIRGLVCHNCNRGMGLLKDNPKILIEAAAYLCRDIPEVAA